MRKNKGFSLVELIIVIAIMAILVGVLAPQLIKYIEKSKVSSDTQAADTVHSALLTAMMDPEVVNNTNYDTEFSAYTSGKPITAGTYTSTSPIMSAAAEILGGQNGSLAAPKLKSHGASTISFQIVGNNKVSVWIPGTDSTGSKQTSPNIVVE